jgi:hypothetical protein
VVVPKIPVSPLALLIDPDSPSLRSGWAQYDLQVSRQYSGSLGAIDLQLLTQSVMQSGSACATNGIAAPLTKNDIPLAIAFLRETGLMTDRAPVRVGAPVARKKTRENLMVTVVCFDYFFLTLEKLFD